MAVGLTLKRRRLLIGILSVAAVLTVAGAALHRRTLRVRPVMELAPASALVYIEVSDLQQLVSGLQSTAAWEKLAPILIERHASDQRALRAATGHLTSGEWLLIVAGLRSPELALLAKSQVGMVVTGFEVEGEELIPHLAILISSRSDGESLSALARDQLRTLAKRAYGDFVSETQRYDGVETMMYHSADGRRRIVWAVFERALVIATHDDALRAVIDAGRGRKPSLAVSDHLRALRPVVDQQGLVFGMLSSSALSHLMDRWSPHSLESAPSLRLARDLLKAALSTVSFNLVFAVNIEDRQVISKSLLSLDETWCELFSPSINSQAELKTVRFIPQQARSFTIYRFADLPKTVQALEELISQRASVATIVLRELSARMKSSFGLAPSDSITDAIGNEIAVIDTGGERLLFVVETRNQLKLAALIGKYLKHLEAKPLELTHKGLSIFSSSDDRSEAFAFVENYLLIGSQDQIKTALESRAERKTVGDDQSLVDWLHRRGSAGFEVAVSYDQQEIAASLAVIDRWLKPSHAQPKLLETEAVNQALRQLPPSIRTSQIKPEGLYSETRSPLGIFSTILSLFSDEP